MAFVGCQWDFHYISLTTLKLAVRLHFHDRPITDVSSMHTSFLLLLSLNSAKNLAVAATAAYFSSDISAVVLRKSLCRSVSDMGHKVKVDTHLFDATSSFSFVSCTAGGSCDDEKVGCRSCSSASLVPQQ